MVDEQKTCEWFICGMRVTGENRNIQDQNDPKERNKLFF
jgi:hypothetical protein